jgi:hypothetical protein
VADTKVSDLTAGAPAVGTDEIHIARAGTDRKLDLSDLSALYHAVAGTDVPVTDGGTGASTAADARTNLGLGTAATSASGDFAAASHNHAASAITSGEVALARGGTGASLVDPNADRLMFWDDSAGAMAFLTAGSGLTITDTTITAAAGSGDVVGPASSVDGETALFDLTTGKLLKRSTLTGIRKATSGVDSAAVAGTDYADRSPIYALHYAATIAEDYYTGTHNTISIANVALAADTVFYFPWIAPWNASVVRDLTMRVVTGVASTSFRFCLYSSSADGLPSSRVENTESGEQGSETNNLTRTFTPGATVTLTKGALYWAALVSNGAPSLRCHGVANGHPTVALTGVPVGSSGVSAALSAAFSYAELPATATAPTARDSSRLVLIGARFTS